MSAQVFDFAAERAKRRPNEQTPVSPWASWSDRTEPPVLPAPAHCIVCRDPDGIACCDYGRVR